MKTSPRIVLALALVATAAACDQSGQGGSSNGTAAGSNSASNASGGGAAGGSSASSGRATTGSTGSGGAGATGSGGTSGVAAGSTSGGASSGGGGTSGDAGNMCGGYGARCTSDADCCTAFACEYDDFEGYDICQGISCTVGVCDGLGRNECCPGFTCAGIDNFCDPTQRCNADDAGCLQNADCCLGSGCVLKQDGDWHCTEGRSCKGSHEACQSNDDCCPYYDCRTLRYDGQVCVSQDECGVWGTPCGSDGVPCCSGYTCQPDSDGSICMN